MIKPSDFIHPEDDAALRQLESIPGFIALSRRAMELGYENYRYGLNMASSIRLSPMQLPELYNKLPPICEKLGMSVPEFYLEMKLKPNAVCSGVKRTYIIFQYPPTCLYCYYNFLQFYHFLFFKIKSGKMVLFYKMVICRFIVYN